MENSYPYEEEEIVRAENTIGANQSNGGEDNVPVNDSIKDNKPSTYIDPIKYDDVKGNYITIPGDTYIKQKRVLDKLKKLDKDFVKNLTPDEQIAIGIGIEDTVASPMAGVDNPNYNITAEDGEGNVISLKGYPLKPKPKRGSKRYTGKDAIAVVLSKVTKMDTLNIPLYNSGIWVTLTPFTDDELVELDVALEENEIHLGKRTSGLIYTGYSSTILEIVKSFVSKHLTSSSLDVPIEDIWDYILLPDLDLLVAGLIRTSYSKGFDIVKSCKNTLVIEDNKPKCTYILKAKLDIANCIIPDADKIKDKHTKILANKKPNSITVDDWKEYTSDIIPGSIITIEEVVINMEVPTVNRAIEYTSKWVDGIEDRLDSVLVNEHSKAEKNNAILKLAKNSKILALAHYISKLVVNDGIIDSKDDIFETINILASIDDKTNEMIINKLLRYIKRSRVAGVYVDNFVCPSCQDKFGPATEPLISLNIVQSFFQLAFIVINKRMESQDIS